MTLATPAPTEPDEGSPEVHALQLLDEAARQRLDVLAQLACRLFDMDWSAVVAAGEATPAGSGRGSAVSAAPPPVPAALLAACTGDLVCAGPGAAGQLLPGAPAPPRTLAVLPLRAAGGALLGWLWLASASPRDFDAAAQARLRDFGALVAWELEQDEQVDDLLHDAARRADIHALTLLPRSHVVGARLAQALAAGGEVLVAFLDLHDVDRLRLLAGAGVAEQVLRLLAERLKQHCHEAAIGYWRRDQLLLFQPLADAAGSRERLLAPLRRCLAERFVVDDFEYDLTASVGLSRFPADATDVPTLIACARAAVPEPGEADECLNAALYSPAQAGVDERSPVARFELARRLKHALRHGSLRLEYQPVIDLRSGRLAGAEALLRWNDPQFGEVSPAEFIPVAEQSRLILDLGDFVLREVIALIRQWRAAGHPRLPIAANVSPTQLRQPSFAAHLAQLLAEGGIEGAALGLEITEHALLVQDARVTRNLAQVARLGVAVAIDDFGAGYSSFAHVRTLPLKLLKIDREFIVNLTGSARDRQIVQAVISMAHVLGLEVLAEGVEQERQLRVLRQLGCDYVQGYLLGRPMASAQLLERLLETQPA